MYQLITFNKEINPNKAFTIDTSEDPLYLFDMLIPYGKHWMMIQEIDGDKTEDLVSCHSNIDYSLSKTGEALFGERVEAYRKERRIEYFHSGINSEYIKNLKERYYQTQVWNQLYYTHTVDFYEREFYEQDSWEWNKEKAGYLQNFTEVARDYLLRYEQEFMKTTLAQRKWVDIYHAQVNSAIKKYADRNDSKIQADIKIEDSYRHYCVPSLSVIMKLKSNSVRAVITSNSDWVVHAVSSARKQFENYEPDTIAQFEENAKSISEFAQYIKNVLEAATKDMPSFSYLLDTITNEDIENSIKLKTK